MAARVALALVALGALGALRAHAQPTFVDVRVDPTLNDVDSTSNDVDDVEKRYTPELEAELQSAKDDALLLFTEFSARAGGELKVFIREMTALLDEARESTEDLLDRAPPQCRSKFEDLATEAVHNARRAASFSAENHHKFFLGHMIVLRMHLNKSEDYLRKCDKVFKECGIACETTPRVIRWRRHAAQEINRVRDDIQHSRRSYEDLLTHSHRKLNHLRKRTKDKVAYAVQVLQRCVALG